MDTDVSDECAASIFRRGKKTSVHIYYTTLHHILEDRNLIFMI